MFRLVLLLNLFFCFQFANCIPTSYRNAINLKFLESLPERVNDVFLGSLFNSSLKNVLELADRFKFCAADPSELKFFQYLPEEQRPIEINPFRSGLNVSVPTKIIVHGWFGSGDNRFVTRFAEQYHKRGKYNVIGVDWSRHSKRDYVAASCTSRDIGKAIADFILKMINYNLNLLKDVHIIGHSLGAHLAGFAGKFIKNETRGIAVGRITSLDAAAPLFEYPVRVPKDLRLDKDDAVFVDGIHTNMGFFGFASSYGTADFYAEHGSLVQPGCSTGNFFEDLVCSHARSVDLFHESILSKRILGTACHNPILFLTNICKYNEKVLLGEDAPWKINGPFYLKTNDKSPFISL